MPGLEDILGGRVMAMAKGGTMKGDGKFPFFFFCNRILECVAGKKKFKAEKSKVLISNSCASVSDEAFALLLMVNGWDKFDFLSDQSKKDGDEDTPPTMFTEKKGRNRKLKGWSSEGIDKYNKLCHHVKKDRESEQGKMFEVEFKKYYVDECKRNGVIMEEMDDGDETDEEEGGGGRVPKRFKRAFNHLGDDEEPTTASNDVAAIGTGQGVDISV